MRAKPIAETLVAVLKAKRIDKATAAREMGVNASTISRICAAKFTSITDANAERITKWLARNGVVIPEANVTVITGGFKRVRVYGLSLIHI